jgi:hypothetical protein
MPGAVTLGQHSPDSQGGIKARQCRPGGGASLHLLGSASEHPLQSMSQMPLAPSSVPQMFSPSDSDLLVSIMDQMFRDKCLASSAFYHSHWQSRMTAKETETGQEK